MIFPDVLGMLLLQKIAADICVKPEEGMRKSVGKGEREMTEAKVGGWTLRNWQGSVTQSQLELFHAHLALRINTVGLIPLQSIFICTIVVIF